MTDHLIRALTVAYERAQTIYLEDQLATGAEAVGRLEISGDLKTQTDMTTLRRSIANAKTGYKEMEMFELENDSIRRRIDALELKLRELERFR